MINKNICKTYTVTFTELGYNTPGSNYIRNGNHSGEEFYEIFFEEKLRDAMINDYCLIFTDKEVYGIPHTYFRTIIELAIETYGLLLADGYINIEKSDIDDNLKNLYNETIKFYSNKLIGYKHPDNLLYVKRYNR